MRGKQGIGTYGCAISTVQFPLDTHCGCQEDAPLMGHDRV